MEKLAAAGAADAALAESLLAKVRIPFVQRAELVRRGETVAAFLFDLGLTGVFVEHAQELRAGERVSIRFRLPGNEIPVEALCRVAWLHSAGAPPAALPPGVGLEFVEISERDHGRVRDHLSDYCGRATRARRFARPWPAGGERDR